LEIANTLLFGHVNGEKEEKRTMKMWERKMRRCRKKKRNKMRRRNRQRSRQRINKKIKIDKLTRDEEIKKRRKMEEEEGRNITDDKMGWGGKENK
jgi:hypothetical protein